MVKRRDDVIKINFADTGSNGIVERFITTTLDEMGYKYVISNRPDYLFCGDFMTYQFLEYDCIKVYVCAENEFPNFNLYDYAIGEYEIDYDKRYLRYPFYLWRDGTKEAFNNALNKKIVTNGFDRKFCNMVVSNGNMSASYRRDLFFKLSEYKKVDSAGGYLNNMGGEKIPKSIDRKLEFSSGYKFSIACENASHPGYTTEKIIEAWNAGTIPIYWGNPNIGLEFNEEAFVNCHAYSSIEEVLNRIRTIDEDESVYNSMLNQPIINEFSGAKKYITNELLFHFFSNIFDVPYEQAKIIISYSRVGGINRELRGIVKESFYWNIYRSLTTTDGNRMIKKLINIMEKDKVYIYGAGAMGRYVAKTLQDNGVIVFAFIDRDKGVKSDNCSNKPIYTVEEVNKDDGAVVINTVYDPIGEISKGLEKRLMMKVIGIEDFLQ